MSHLLSLPRLPIRMLLPSAVTMTTLACGLAAIEATYRGGADMAFRLILLAGIADGADGALARRLGVAGAFGAQLDSLADVVAFGAAPAFLLLHFGGVARDSLPGALEAVVAGLFVLAGAFRLARFHAEPSSWGFLGLPITAGGCGLAAIVAGPGSAIPLIGFGAALVLGVLMVCRQPFPKFVAPRGAAAPILAVVLIGLALSPWSTFAAALSAAILVVYCIKAFTSHPTHTNTRGSVAEVEAAPVSVAVRRADTPAA